MSKTLFWYLFVDLLRIFLMTAGTLAGIMSFAGLLRPLTEQGLDVAQVGKMLTYLTPAMMTYSLPVAALFATTVVYGRLAADNELTACKASGIAYWVIGFPALVLGFVVAILSLLLLCFLVPYFSLKVEQVIYSNLGKVVVNHIERDHQLRFAGSSLPTIFAQTAHMLPSDPMASRDQLVELSAPMIVTTEHVPGTAPDLRVPREFYCAKSAVIRIHPLRESLEPTDAEPGDNTAGDEGAEVSILLDDGTKFPRVFEGEIQGGVQATTFGPLPFPSPIRENVKFMDILTLIRLAGDPSGSQRVSEALDNLIRADEERTFLNELSTDVSQFGTHRFPTALDEQYVLSTDNPQAPTNTGQELIFTSDGDAQQIYLSKVGGEQTTLTAQASEVRIHAKPDEADSPPQMVVTIDMYKLKLTEPSAEPTERPSWSTTFNVEMTGPVLSVRNDRNLKTYDKAHNLDANAANLLNREQAVVNNAVRGEMHSRASFAISCPILVLMGCALGMMFKSGNFLTAFAVSFLPALLCITLNVGGQQTADHVPAIVGANFLQDDPSLRTGLMLIWGGNAVVLALAVGLIRKLTRR